LFLGSWRPPLFAAVIVRWILFCSSFILRMKIRKFGWVASTLRFHLLWNPTNSGNGECNAWVY
jgi:hypothetical protein